MQSFIICTKKENGRLLTLSRRYDMINPKYLSFPVPAYALLHSERIDMNKTKSYGFFSRMLLICTILLMSFSIIASIIVGFLSHQYEKTQFLKNYDLAMANLSEAFYERFASYNLLAGKLIRDGQCNPDLCTLLEASSFDEVSADVRSNCISLLSSICQDDRYLRGFLLYSTETENLYLYSVDRSYLSYAAQLPELPEITPYVGTKLDNGTMERLISACNSGQESNMKYYGIASTLFYNPSRPLGYLIPLFSTGEFENILSNYRLDASSVFRIGDGDGSVYYQSYPFSEQASSAVYSGFMSNRQYGFDVSYSVPRSLLPKSSITYLIVTFAVIVTLFSFGLSYMTYYLSNKNITGILDGMNQFNVGNLAYRIALPRGHNEFTQIIEGFNRMCDELQQNVERSYVYELQQKKSELYALQTSINPHFLYNTLEMIRNQIQSARPGEAAQMILLLSKIYRSQTNTNMFVTLEDEVELCENLMILYQYRFQNFEYEFDMDRGTERFALPKNTLQPLIENYFVHGIVAERQDNLFLLHMATEERQGKQYVHLSLCNNGNPIKEEKLAAIGDKLNQGIYANKEAEGFALTNVYNRLRIAFQEDCTMSVSSGGDDMRFQIDLCFPATGVEKLRESFL